MIGCNTNLGLLQYLQNTVGNKKLA